VKTVTGQQFHALCVLLSYVSMYLSKS